MKSRYWVLLVLVSSIAFFGTLAFHISTRQTLRRQALTAAGNNLPYQLIISDYQGIVGDIIYTNDYEILPSTNGLDSDVNLYVRWGAMWQGECWGFLFDPTTFQNVRVQVNTGDAIQ